MNKDKSYWPKLRIHARGDDHTSEEMGDSSAAAGAGYEASLQLKAHAASEELLTRVFSTSFTKGLSQLEAQMRFRHYGPNLLPQPKGESVFSIFFRQINNPLVYVLIVSAGLAVFLGKVVDGIVVAGVVLINALIGFMQEWRAGRAISALSKMVAESAQVLRDGERVSIPSSQLVPGDVVFIQGGDKVPADLRMLELKNLRIEEAALTGESVPLEKSDDPVAENATLGDRTNMAFSGTYVTSGAGRGLVIGTGVQTELGKISNMLTETTELETPLTAGMHKVGKTLTVGILGITAVLVLIAYLRGFPFADAVLAGISLAVAAIPEGLPAIITIALAIGVRRMAHAKAIIRKLPAVETLGSTSVICSDKTGTLTRNEMTVQALWTADGKSFSLSGIGYVPHGKLFEEDREAVVSQPIRALIESGVLCNDATLRNEAEIWKIEGDPTEGALIVAAEKVGIASKTLVERSRRIDVVPFESELQYMATLHEFENGQRLLTIKGAPEVVLSRCRGTNHFGVEVNTQVPKAVTKMGRLGMRVLGVASKVVTETKITPNLLNEGFEFLGLQGMIDPPRPEAIEAVGECQRAGIRVKMITGDHKVTAEAIARQLGILRQDDPPAVAGTDISRMSDEELKGVARSHHVFARVAPEHKLRLVRAIQSAGHIVAMTGDGVNDAPSLKQSNIGIAMGITGTAVSKEAADIVLTDDNFATIRAAVEEGRRVYDNLIKSLAFVLPTNIGQALIVTAAILAFPIVNGQPLMPILPVQVLWINLVTTIALALPLAFEAKEPGIMQRAPRNPKEPLLGPFVLYRSFMVAVLMAAAGVGLFLYQFYGDIAAGVEKGLALSEAQTAAVTTVVLMQIFYLFNCRSLKSSMWRIGIFSNPKIFIGIGALIVLQVAFVYAPWLNAAFGTAPLSPKSWALAIVAAMTVLPVISVEKWWRSRRRES